MIIGGDSGGGFRLFSGNRLETLADCLSEWLGEGIPVDSFAAETVVVQSRGMERWLSLRLSGCQKVAANMRFPFCRKLIEDYAFAPLLLSLGVGKESLERFQRQSMAFKLMEVMPGYLERPGFELLSRYVGNDPSRLKLYQLSERVAGCFDNYLTYRPDLINAWDRGENPMAAVVASHWQMRLWRRLTREFGTWHFASLYRIFLEHCHTGAGHVSSADFGALQGLGRVACFGFSSLAPAFLDILLGMSKHVEMAFFHLNPCEEYWELNRSRKTVLKAGERTLSSLVERAAMKGTGAERIAPEESLGFSCENELLGSWGEQGREFFGLLCSIDGVDAEAVFADDGDGGSLLARLRRDVRAMTHPSNPEVLDDDDRSLLINSCHSPMREVEVLRDYLIDAFNADPGLLPEDVLVLVPDIDVYAPYIEAVFRTVAHDDPAWMFCTIADRADSSGLPEVMGFLKLLDLDRMRFRVSCILDMLNVESIRHRFGIGEDDLPLLRRWLSDTGVNWGIDSEYRLRKTGAAFNDNSWRSGLERMLWGFAVMPDHRLWTDRAEDLPAIMPYDNIEGDGALLLGRFCEFLERCFAFHLRAGEMEEGGAGAMDWLAFIRGGIDDFFSPLPEAVGTLGLLRGAAGHLEEQLKRSSTSGLSMDLALVRQLIAELPGGGLYSGGFLQGGVTFCQARPLRSIPARIVCMLGMNERDYPRRDSRVSFDLMPSRPAFGDHSVRNDDRYLFLDTLLSARERFYLSFVGQSLKENADMPPSVLVSELCDYVSRHYRFDGDTLPLERMFLRHPLQAFSADYFRGGNLRSYSQVNCEAARTIAAGLSDTELTRRSMAVEGGLPERLSRLSLDDLAAFFANPAKAFCNWRLEVRLETKEAMTPDDSERHGLDALDCYGMAMDLLDRHLGVWAERGGEAFAAALRASLKAEGRLPVGPNGAFAFDNFFREFSSFADKLSIMAGRRLEGCRLFHVAGNGNVTLDSRLDSFYETGVHGRMLLMYRYARWSVKDDIRCRLGRLSLGLPGVRGHVSEHNISGVMYISRAMDEVFSDTLAEPDKACAAMELLTDFYAEGMSRPLEFLPDCSKKYYDNISGGKDEAEALSAALRDWPGASGFIRPADIYCERCYGSEPPVDGEFIEGFKRCSLGIWKALDALSVGGGK